MDLCGSALDSDDGLPYSYDAAKDSRGWAMRRGHCRRLCRDSGKESCRGRASFARSLGRKSNVGKYDSELRGRGRRLGGAALRERISFSLSAVGDEYSATTVVTPSALRLALLEEELALRIVGCFGQQPDAWAAPRTEDEGEEVEGDDLEENAQYELPNKGASFYEDEIVKTRKLPPPCLMRLRSTPVTKCEVMTASVRAQRALVPLAAWSVCALTRATKEPSMNDCITLHEASTTLVPPVPECDPTAFAVKQDDAALHQSSSKRAKRAAQREPIHDLRASFLKRHGHQLCSRVGAYHQYAHVQLCPAPVSLPVQQRFLTALPASTGVESLIPAWHGTKKELHASIFETGLRVPDGKHVSVRNGSAYGNGVYTAAADNPGLSTSYANSSCLLVCAIIDCNDEKRLKKHGSFNVTFDDSLIIPLFEAIGDGQRPTNPTAKSTSRYCGRLADGERVRAFWDAALKAGKHTAARQARRTALRQTKAATASARHPDPLVSFFLRKAARKRHGVGSSK